MARGSPASAPATASWSVDGVATTEVDPENVTSPTLNVSGRFSMNAAAACLAASIRVGGTSVASIERDTSRATMTVACSWGTRTSTTGRAAAGPSR